MFVVKDLKMAAINDSLCISISIACIVSRMHYVINCDRTCVSFCRSSGAKGGEGRYWTTGARRGSWADRLERWVQPDYQSSVKLHKFQYLMSSRELDEKINKCYMINVLILSAIR